MQDYGVEAQKFYLIRLEWVSVCVCVSVVYLSRCLTLQLQGTVSAAGLRRKKKKEKKILALSGISWLNKGSSRRQGFPIQSTHHPTHPHRHTHTYALNYSRDPLGLQFITPSSRPQLPQAAGCVLLLKEAPLMQCYISRSKRQKSQTTVHQRQLKKKKAKR